MRAKDEGWLRVPYKPPRPDPRAFLLERFAEIEERCRAPEVQAAFDGAEAEARAIARMLKERFGATRVRLYGSLARRDNPEGFDIDLAVEGIAPGRFFEAFCEAARLVTRKLDLVDLGDATPELRRFIERDGVDLQ